MKKLKTLLFLPLLLLSACDGGLNADLTSSDDYAIYSPSDNPVTQSVLLQLGKSSIWDVEGYTTCSVLYEPLETTDRDVTFSIVNKNDASKNNILSYKYGYLVLSESVSEVTNFDITAELKSYSPINDTKTLEVKPFVKNVSDGADSTATGSNLYAYEKAYIQFANTVDTYCVIVEDVHYEFCRSNNGAYNGKTEFVFKFHVLNINNYRSKYGNTRPNQCYAFQLSAYNAAGAVASSVTILDTNSSVAGAVKGNFPYSDGDYFEVHESVDMPLANITDSYTFKFNPTF